MLSPQLHIMLLCFIQCIYNSLSWYFSLFACLSPALECKLHEIRESRASWKWKSLGCVWLCNPMDCNSPGSSIHGILQAGILEGVAIPSSRGSFQPRDQTRLVHCRQILYHLTTTTIFSVPWTIRQCQCSTKDPYPLSFDLLQRQLLGSDMILDWL